MANNATMNASMDEAIEIALGQMDGEQRDHFRTVCAALLAAYIDESMHALILIGKDEDESPEQCEVVQILAVNATDINSAQMVGGAIERIGTIVMQDAPPREMFN